MKHPISVALSESDRASLQTFIHVGKANARTFTRAHALLKAADGWTDQQICEVFGISRNTSIRVRELYPASVDSRRFCMTSGSSAVAKHSQEGKLPI